MKTLYMMKGLPASGKSTAAKQMLNTLSGRNMKIVNKDLLRLMLDDGHWSRVVDVLERLERAYDAWLAELTGPGPAAGPGSPAR